jgi:hypothetical protein
MSVISGYEQRWVQKQKGTFYYSLAFDCREYYNIHFWSHCCLYGIRIWSVERIMGVIVDIAVT